MIKSALFHSTVYLKIQTCGTAQKICILRDFLYRFLFSYADP